MNQIASASQRRMSLLRWALIVIPLTMFLGFLSGTMSGSTADNAWYQALIKPDIQPPGWVFGVVWPTLYLLMGLAFAMVLAAHGARVPHCGDWPVPVAICDQPLLVAPVFWTA